MISALEHYSYCPRQFALIHMEQVYEENVYTMRGNAVHKKVHESDWETLDGGRIERGLPLWNARLGLVGKSDVVEFLGEIPYPIEYKHGYKREKEHDDVQLCAQALCLEEMLGLDVPCGAIYHHSSRRRREVVFTPECREKTESIVSAIRVLLASGQLPPALNDHHCHNCSLKNSCIPEIADRSRWLSEGRRLFEMEQGREEAK